MKAVFLIFYYISLCTEDTTSSADASFRDPPPPSPLKGHKFLPIFWQVETFLLVTGRWTMKCAISSLLQAHYLALSTFLASLFFYTYITPYGSERTFCAVTGSFRPPPLPLPPRGVRGGLSRFWVTWSAANVCVYITGYNQLEIITLGSLAVTADSGFYVVNQQAT